MGSMSMQWGSNGVGGLASAFLINKQIVVIMLIKCQQTNRVHACVTHTELSVYTRIAACSRLTPTQRARFTL